MTSLETLDPNYVIVFPNEGKNETDLVSILQNNGLQPITRPGCANNTCYMFTKITTVSTYTKVNTILKNLSFVTKHYPFFDNEKAKNWDNLYLQLNPGKFAFPTPKSYQLQLMAEISKNPKLALYFEFFNHYNKYLKNLSIVGIFFWFISSKSNPDEFNKYYSMISIFFTLVFLTSWIFSKQNKVISQLNQYVVDIPRNFNTKDARSVLIKKVLFFPVSAAFVVTLVTFQLFCFAIEIYINQIYLGPFGSILSLIPTVLISVFIPVLTTIYNKFFINIYLNVENGSHSKKSTLEKNFILLFFSNYMPLLITLILYLPFGHLINNERIVSLSTLGLPINTKELYLSINTSRHQKQFFYFIFTNQIIALVTKYVLPLVLKKLAGKKAKKDNKNKTNMELTLQNEYPRDFKFWKKAENFDVKVTEPFDVDEGYQKLILQFGFIAMFSSIWPLAPLVIYLINQLVLKADLWKCFKNSRPALLPLASVQGSSNRSIGIDMKPWDDILKIMVWISVIVGSSITYMYQRNYLPGVGHATELEKRDQWYAYNPISKSGTSIFIFGVVVEHICMLIYMMLRKYYVEYQDVSNGKGECYGMVPDMDVDDRVYAAVEDKKPVESEVEIETVSGMKIDHGYTPSGQEDGEWRQRGGDREDESSMPRETQADENENENENAMNRDGLMPTENKNKNKGTTLDPSCKVHGNKNRGNGKYDTNFAKSESDVAGATLPAIIPTSKNYHLRFDSEGNEIVSTDTLLNSDTVVHNPPTTTVLDTTPPPPPPPTSQNKQLPMAAVAPNPVTLKNPPIITIEDEDANEDKNDEDANENMKGSEDSLDTKENTYTSNKSLKSAAMDEEEEPKRRVNETVSDTNKDALKSSGASVQSKHRSILSTASHKINQKRKSISSNTHPHRPHSDGDKEKEKDKAKGKKKKKGLFGKLKI